MYTYKEKKWVKGVSTDKSQKGKYKLQMFKVIVILAMIRKNANLKNNETL
jgi:hypothetical protein